MPMMKAFVSAVTVFCLFVLGPAHLLAGEVLVAVATNFLNPMKEIASQFEVATGHHAAVSAGSSGKLFAQIQHGAPFDVFLSADSQRPQRLEQQGQGVKGTCFVYAVGRLVLWSRDQTMFKDSLAPVFQKLTFRHLALANPKTAPYGRAALQTLQKLQAWGSVQDRIVQGENVGQALQYVASGNAELGFVALSQVVHLNQHDRGSWWEVPSHFHDPITQSAILLTPGQQNPAASFLLEFLQSLQGKQILEKFGYVVQGKG